MQHEQDNRNGLRFSIRSLLIATAILAAAIVFYRTAITGRISSSQLDQLQDGMTKDEVIAILGKPADESDISTNEWQYGYRFTEVFVVFDGQAPVVDLDRMWMGW